MGPWVVALGAMVVVVNHHRQAPLNSLIDGLEEAVVVELAMQHSDTSSAESVLTMEKELGALNSQNYNQCVLPPVGTLALLSQSRRSIGV